MSVLFAGGELEAFNSNSANIVELTTGGRFDSAYARCSIRCGIASLTTYIEMPAFAAQTGTVGAHWEWYSAQLASGSTMLCLYDSSGTAVFRLQATAASVLQAQYWNGSAWTNIGSTYTVTTSSLLTFDLKVVCGGSGSFELFVAGSSVASGSASMGSVTNISTVRLFNCSTSANTSSQTHVSQIIVADEVTVGWKFYLLPPTGNGTSTAFTGDYTAVDEQALSDADFVESTAVNDVETFTYTPPALGSGTVKAVVVSGRVKNTAGENAQFALRRAGTNYFTSNLAGIGAGFAPFVGIWNTDPSTSAAWLGTNAVSATNEFGAKETA